MSLSDEQRAVIEAARGIRWDFLDAAIGVIQSRACVLGEHGLYNELEVFAQVVAALHDACTLLKAAETRELLTERP